MKEVKDFVENFIKKHKEIEKLSSLELLMLIIQLHNLINRLNDLLLEKILEEAKRLKRPKPKHKVK